MGWLSALAPVAQLGLAASGVGLPLALGGGALVGGLAARERNQEQLERQRRTSQAEADQQAVQWATGRGPTVKTQWADSPSGNLMAGTTGGAMSVYGLRQMPNIFGSLSGSAAGYDPSSQLENQFGFTSYEDAASGYDPNSQLENQFGFNSYGGKPSLFQKARR